MVDVAAEATLLDVAEEAASLIDLPAVAAVFLTPTQSRGSGVDAAAAGGVVAFFRRRGVVACF
jgi:hypothetical protein